MPITLQVAHGKDKRINRAPGKEFVMENFLEPGLVSYEAEGAGVARLDKEAIDKMIPSFIGVPVVIDHIPDDKNDILNGRVKNADGSNALKGRVTRAWWNADTGKFDCAFVLEDAAAEEIMRNGGYDKGSCAYTVTETGPGGELHAMKYDEQILNGEFDHLALVQNPRYEDCRVLMNGKIRWNSKPVAVKENRKKFTITKEFEDGSRFTEETDVSFTEGEVVSKPVGGKAYKIVSVRENAIPYCDACDRTKDKCVCGKENFIDRSKWTPEFTAQFDKEKKEHPEFPDEQIVQIVLDHAKEKNKGASGDHWMNSTITLKQAK